MSEKTVFISYSHKDEAWKDKLLPHLHALANAGVEMEVWHDRKIDGGDKWYPEIQEAMADAAIGVLLISADFLASGFITKEEVPYLIERHEKQGMLLIPVLVRKCAWKTHRWLADRQMLPRDGKCIAIDFPGDQADAIFSDVAEAIYSHFARLAAQPQKASAIPVSVQKLVQAEVAKIPVKPSESRAVQTWPALAKERVDLSHLPETGAALFGRDDELSLLDKVWAGEEPSSEVTPTRVLAFKAQGGVGKSTLINHWLAEMKRDHFRGASRAFGWSFYSQGVRDHGAPSADAFVAAALRFFGDEAMAASPASAWEKGECLARLVGAERALLVLDGMEPLQSADAVQRGKLQDPALESLLRGLARHSAGLCIITTREPLAELGKKSGIVERDLEQISPQAGRALLRMARINGTDLELEALAGRFGPHALAISLLAVYLHEQPGRGLGPAEELEKLPGDTPVNRVLAGFEQWFGNCAELEVLRLLGFFDRPADEGCLRALRAEPIIKGLTDVLTELDNADWHRVLARLEKLRFLHVRQGDTGRGFVDTHPLIREHFANQIREKNPWAWVVGHKRLYKHLRASAKASDKPTLEELQPFYEAAAHACMAAAFGCAWDVYTNLIQRGKYYATNKLGAAGSDLAALAGFFRKVWGEIEPEPRLSSLLQSKILRQVAFSLRSVGRLKDAESVSTLAFAKWERADLGGNIMAAAIISEVKLILGKTREAEEYGWKAVSLSRDEIDERKVSSRCSLATALHQSNKIREAFRLFEEAEQIEKIASPKTPKLRSLQGFDYHELLLGAVECGAWRAWLRLTETSAKELKSRSQFVRQRATETLRYAIERGIGILSVEINRLTLERVALYDALLASKGISSTNASSNITSVTNGLKRAGQQRFVVSALLTRAWHRRVLDLSASDAKSDLNDAWDIAESGPMKLHMADIHLYRARLFGRTEDEGRGLKYPWDKNPDGSSRGPADDLAEARRLIEECGYWRRKEELEDAERALLGKTR